MPVSSSRYSISLLASIPEMKLELSSGSGFKALSIVLLPEPLSPLINTILCIHLVKSISISYKPIPLYIPP